METGVNLKISFLLLRLFFFSSLSLLFPIMSHRWVLFRSHLLMLNITNLIFTVDISITPFRLSVCLSVPEP